MRGRGKWRGKSKDNGSHTTRGRFRRHKGEYAAADETATRRVWHPRLFFTKDARSTSLGIIGASRAAAGG